MAGKKGMRHYSLDVKREAVRVFLEEGKTYGEVAEGLGITAPQRVKIWVRQFRCEGDGGLAETPRAPPPGHHGGRRTGTAADGERPPKKIPFRIASTYAREAQYRVIYHYRTTYSVKAMCAVWKISRAAYYAWVQRMNDPPTAAERFGWVEQAYQASHQTYGYRRITLWIRRRHDVRINPKAVLRIMQQLGLRSVVRGRKRPRGLRLQQVEHWYPNVLQRHFSAQRPNAKWVTDVTFIRTRTGWGYLSTIKDLYGGFIVAHVLGRQNSQALVNRTLAQAQQHEPLPAGLILHSDQGYQYRAPAYFLFAQAHQLIPSMSRRGNCWDNAPMENFFGQLKTEALQRVKQPTFEEVQQLVDNYIHFYNYERIQLKTKQTPYERRCLFP